MNKYKILVGINIVLLFSLIVCVFFLTKKDTVKETIIELLYEIRKETQDDFSKHFKYYEMRNFFIREEIDSFYVFVNQENRYCSPQLMDYYDKKVSSGSQETEKIFKTICSIQNKQSQDFILMSKFMEYRFIKKVIEHSGYLSFSWFDGLSAKVFSKKDTIQMGEEYMANIGCVGIVFNKDLCSVVVLDGDTLDASFGYCEFKEKPQKRGLIKHKGLMIQGSENIPFEFEYYVK